MANIFQKIFYSPIECRILDFIKQNKNNIEYSKKPKFDEFNVNIGTIHGVTIDADGMRLHAQLTKYKTNYLFRDNDFSYTFQCKRQKDQEKCKNCALYDKISEFSGFAATVYTRMLTNYVAKNGCPCER